MIARYEMIAWAILSSALLNMPAAAQDRPEDYRGALRMPAAMRLIANARGVRTGVATYWHARSPLSSGSG